MTVQPQHSVPQENFKFHHFSSALFFWQSAASSCILYLATKKRRERTQSYMLHARQKAFNHITIVPSYCLLPVKAFAGKSIESNYWFNKKSVNIPTFRIWRCTPSHFSHFLDIDRVESWLLELFKLHFFKIFTPPPILPKSVGITYHYIRPPSNIWLFLYHERKLRTQQSLELNIENKNKCYLRQYM